jgi:hypothetical protein
MTLIIEFAASEIVKSEMMKMLRDRAPYLRSALQLTSPGKQAMPGVEQAA